MELLDITKTELLDLPKLVFFCFFLLLQNFPSDGFSVSSWYQIKNWLCVLTISVDKNDYFHPSSAISPLKAFTIHVYEHAFQWKGWVY